MFDQLSQYEIKIPTNSCLQKPLCRTLTAVSEAQTFIPNTPPNTPSPTTPEANEDITAVEAKPTNVVTTIEADIEVVCVVQKSNIDLSKCETYYDNDEVTDSTETLRRWNVKASADTKINHSRMNHRKRVHNDERPRQERRFLPGIFCEKSSENDGNYEDKLDMDRFAKNPCKQTPSKKNNKQGPRFRQDNSLNESSGSSPKVSIEQNDEEDLQTRLDELDFGLKVKVADLRKELKRFDTEVHNNYQQALNSINSDYSTNIYQKNSLKTGLKLNFMQIKKSNKGVFYDKLFAIKNQCNAEKDALTTLFKSGNYQKGKIKDYISCDLYQPRSKRRKYDDDGHRKMLLLETDAMNILIEDHIYNFFYGIPNGFT